MVDSGCDVNVADNEGFTLLHYAASQGKDDLVRKLLSKNATVDVRNKYGATPLHQAATNGFAEAVDVLLGGGADATITLSKGMTALHLAALHVRNIPTTEVSNLLTSCILTLDFSFMWVPIYLRDGRM